MYEKMYYKLFNAVTDAMDLMEQQSREAEEIYISQ